MSTRAKKSAISHAAGVVLSLTIAIAAVPCVTAGTGGEHPFRQCWQYKFDDAGGQVSADGETVFVSVNPAVIRAVEVKSGRNLWTSDLGGSLVSNLLVTDDAVFAVTGQTSQSPYEKAVLRSLSKQTGITNWTLQLPSEKKVWLGGGGNGIVVMVGESGTITAVSAPERAVRWSAQAGGLNAEPAVFDGKLLVDSVDNRTSVFSMTDGRRTSTFLSSFGATAVSFLFEDKIGIGDERGNIYLFELGESTPAWTHKNGAKIASIQMTEYGSLAASNDNFLYLMSPGGDVIWKRRLPSRPSIRPVNIGEFAFVAASGEKSLYVVNLKSGKFTDQIALDGEAVGAVSIPGEKGIAVLETDSLVRFSSTENCSE
jgi:outer membrane protein assembly factor BamB